MLLRLSAADRGKNLLFDDFQTFRIFVWKLLKLPYRCIIQGLFRDR